jgi:hypothetical protein
MLSRNAYRNLLLLGGSLVLLSSTSCTKQGVKLYPVSGSVSFDGKAPEGAVIYLNPAGGSSKLETLPTGVVKADGTFAVGTFQPGDGAPAGDYDVSIAWYPPNLEAVIIATGKAPSLLPAHLSDPKTSGLKMQVKEGPNEIPAFKLESGKKG